MKKIIIIFLIILFIFIGYYFYNFSNNIDVDFSVFDIRNLNIGSNYIDVGIYIIITNNNVIPIRLSHLGVKMFYKGELISENIYMNDNDHSYLKTNEKIKIKKYFRVYYKSGGNFIINFIRTLNETINYKVNFRVFGFPFSYKDDYLISLNK